jgi:LacI family transcriptional regulator
MPCDHTVEPTISWCAPSSPVRVSTKPEQRVLTGADCPTAMFVSSDLQAFGVLRAIREASTGRSPRDFALVTFDDIEESTFSWPPLTLAQQPVRAMGATISALLRACR